MPARRFFLIRLGPAASPVFEALNTCHQSPQQAVKALGVLTWYPVLLVYLDLDRRDPEFTRHIIRDRMLAGCSPHQNCAHGQRRGYLRTTSPCSRGKANWNIPFWGENSLHEVDTKKQVRILFRPTCFLYMINRFIISPLTTTGEKTFSRTFSLEAAKLGMPQ